MAQAESAGVGRERESERDRPALLPYLQAPPPRYLVVQDREKHTQSQADRQPKGLRAVTLMFCT